MYQYLNAFINRSGDALPGYFARLYDSDGNQVDIFADESGTPISTISGVANAALSDENGMFRWFVANGTYDMRFYDANDVFVSVETGVPMVNAASVVVDLSAETGATLVGTPTGTVQDDIDARPTTAVLAAPTGGGMVGYSALGTGAAPRTLDQLINSLPVMVDDYRQDGDSDDTQAFQRAIAYARSLDGGDVVASDRDYAITLAIPLEGSYDRSPRLVLGSRTVITQTGSNEPVVRVGNEDYYRGGGIIGGGKLVAAAGAGHVVEFGEYGSIASTYSVDVNQENDDKACWYARFPDGGPSDAGLYANRFEGGDWVLPADMSSTVHGFDVICHGPRFNENVISPQRCYNAAIEQFFRISNTQAATWLTNNKFVGVNFQICPGGGLVFDSAKGWTLDSLGFWDAQGDYVNHLIHAADGTGYDSAANSLYNVQRNGDTLATGIRDIFLEIGEDTFVVNCYNGAGPSYDWNSNRVVIVGEIAGELNASERLLLSGAQLVHAANILADRLYADSQIHLGGISNPDQWKLFAGSGYVQHEPVANALGLLLGVKDAGGVLHKLIFENDGSFFAPLEDNLTSLGASGLRWKSGFFALTDAADDAAAAAAGVAVSQLYRTGSAVKVRVA
ncbi:hypothetical protein [Sphingopyxis sp. 22461]|uniref:hypothetical protein n=1 Tax=Sphingopyxis sp. 22461 TaxID=3453923 RepID=UPI003F85C2B2